MQQFARLADSATRVRGVPRLRSAFVPGTLADRTCDELRAFVEGDDPISGRPFMEGVVAQLTTPLDGSDPQGLTFERETPRLLEPDTEENLWRLFEEMAGGPPGALTVATGDETDELVDRVRRIRGERPYEADMLLQAVEIGVDPPASGGRARRARPRA
jgi:hypothetical protein